MLQSITEDKLASVLTLHIQPATDRMKQVLTAVNHHWLLLKHWDLEVSLVPSVAGMLKAMLGNAVSNAEGLETSWLLYIPGIVSINALGSIKKGLGKRARYLVKEVPSDL